MKVTVCALPDEPDAFEPVWAGLCRHIREQGSELVVLPELAGSRWFPAVPEFQEELWRKAMRNLQEINFDPRRPQEHSSGA